MAYTITNLTGAPIVQVDASGAVIATHAASGWTAKPVTEFGEADDISQLSINFYSAKKAASVLVDADGDVKAFPPEQRGVYYIVPEIVARDLPRRRDVLAVDPNSAVYDGGVLLGYTHFFTFGIPD